MLFEGIAIYENGTTGSSGLDCKSFDILYKNTSGGFCDVSAYDEDICLDSQESSEEEKFDNDRLL